MEWYLNIRRISYQFGFFFVTSFSLLLLSSISSLAQTGTLISSGEIYTPKGLEGRVEFWKLIFAKYGKNHRVFHNRSYPEIIYSVIDFSEYEEKLSGKALMDAKLREVDKEKAKIISALLHLSSGNKPRNDFEKRIDILYSGIKGNKLRLMKEGATEEKIRYQTGIRERFHDGLVRSGRYLRAIEHILAEEGLPPELGRLPLVESSFDYTANSSVGAAGIWQFMPATAKRYMKLDNHMDERRDPIIATRAAAKYLKNSYQNTKEWPLAVTSYNHGLSGVMRGVKQVGSINLVDLIEKYDSKSFGFASSNFYAEFLAALEVELNAEHYFPGIVREKAVEFEEILVSRAIRFSDIRSSTGASDEMLIELNRGFKAPILKNQVFIPSGTLVKVPYGLGQRFTTRIAASKIVSKSSEFKSHLYLAGTTFAKTEVSEPSSTPSPLILGKELAPPRASSSSSTMGSSPVSSTPVSYTVKSGDTLSGLARRYSTSVDEIKRMNNFKSPNDLKFGKVIRIPSKGTAYSDTVSKSAASVPVRYTVQSGDTLIQLANTYGSSVSEIMRVNNLSSPSDLKSGSTITIPGDSASSQAVSTSKPSTYLVQRGDTFIGISKKYNRSVNDIMKINGFSSPRDLKAGAKIKIPG
jgi:membrane-bound lytic murein transglycosylase D